MAKPLDGIRVLDFSHALAGPYCTLLLADYGADICKLEAREGDMARGWGPPFAGGISSVFLGLNRGKRGISIDLKQPEGRDLCLRLIDRMDVLVENFRPGSMDRLGLGYESVHQRNPRLVYCSISGYGQVGPSRDEAAMDLVVQSSSGLLSITGTSDTGTSEGESVRCGYGVTDVTAGLFSVIGILLALRARETDWPGTVCGCRDARLYDFHDEFELHELSWLRNCASAHGDGLSDGSAVSRISRGGSVSGDRCGQRETVGRVLPRDRKAGNRDGSGILEQRATHLRTARLWRNCWT